MSVVAVTSPAGKATAMRGVGFDAVAAHRGGIGAAERGAHQKKKKVSRSRTAASIFVAFLRSQITERLREIAGPTQCMRPSAATPAESSEQSRKRFYFEAPAPRTRFTPPP